MRSFQSAKPYAIETRQDPQTRRLIYFASKVPAIPAAFSLIAGDALNNLRSALDHLVGALVVANGKRPSKDTGFPICQYEKFFRSARESQLAGISQAAKQKIETLQRHKGGPELLYAISELNNHDKHRLLITVASRAAGIDIGTAIAHEMWDSMAERVPAIKANRHLMPISSLILVPSDRQLVMTVGEELYSDLPDSLPNPNLAFYFDIAFGEHGIVSGQPLVATLNKMCELVQSIVKDFADFLCTDC